MIVTVGIFSAREEQSIAKYNLKGRFCVLFVIMYILSVIIIDELVKLTKKYWVLLILFTKNKKTNDNFFKFLDKSRKCGYNVSDDLQKCVHF